MTLKTGVIADENFCITELNYILKYINLCIIYVYNLLKTPHMTTTEHLNITKKMQIDGSYSVCSAKCSLYFCKRNYF